MVAETKGRAVGPKIVYDGSKRRPFYSFPASFSSRKKNEKRPFAGKSLSLLGGIQIILFGYGVSANRF